MSKRPNLGKPNEPLLAELREAVARVDKEIIRLCAQRNTLATRIAKIKERAQLPVRNSPIEKKVRERFQKIGAEFGLDSNFLKGLASLLLKSSRLTQTQAKLINKTQGRTSPAAKAKRVKPT